MNTRNSVSEPVKKSGSLGCLKMLTRFWKSNVCWWHLSCSLFCFLASLAHLFVLRLFHMSGWWSSAALHVNTSRSAGLTGSSPVESFPFGHTGSMTFAFPECYPGQFTKASMQKNTHSLVHYQALWENVFLPHVKVTGHFFPKPVASGQSNRLLTRQWRT